MYNFKETEEEILKFWEENKIFDKLREQNKGNDKFKFIDGPITANYAMGVHHVYGRAVKDMYQRYKAMQGYEQRFQNGFDCHGLPVEVNVEKELGIKNKKELQEYGIDKFIEKCKERVEKYSKIITQESIRMGQWMDWGNDYYTMSDNNIEHIWNFLKKCNDNGWIYHGAKVLPWCWRCATSLSQHELADNYIEKSHTAVFLKFPLKGKKNEFALVWTTTPWTLVGNTAAAVNPNLTYVKAKVENEIYYLAKNTLHILEDPEILEEMKGKDLVGWEYTGPFANIELQKGITTKIVPWKEVEETQGTGIVHIAPGCGEADNELGKELNLSTIIPITDEGFYVKGIGELSGKHVTEVLGPILTQLDETNYLLKKEKFKHRYPTCWRCKEDLVFKGSPGWFIKADELREKMLKENNEVKWIPEQGKKMMDDWLQNMKDYNFSRKRYWGLPIPIWKCECGKTQVIGSRKELEEKAIRGMEQLKDLHKPEIDKVILKCECGKEMRRIPEVGDTWLDAGIVPFSTLHYLTDKKNWSEWFPADAIAEMREQVRLWFYFLFMMSVTLEGKAPYKTVVTYEKVYDEKGEEMHKSGKNVIWLKDAIEKMGADTMRWMYCKTNPTQNVHFGYKPAKEINQMFGYLFNINTYLKKQLKEPKKEYGKLNPEDKWFLSRLETTKKQVTNDLDEFQQHSAAKKIEEFLVNDFSRTYIKLIRNRMQEQGEQLSNIMYYALLDVIKMMAPFTPFITEYLYQEYFKQFENKESIHLEKWPSFESKYINENLEDEMKRAQQTIEASHNLRNKIGINLRQPMQDLIIKTETGFPQFIKIIKEQANVKEIYFDKEPINQYEAWESTTLKVYLNKELTPKLEKEGLTRELTRRVQQMRKNMGLIESDEITISINPKPDINFEELQKTTNSKEILDSLEGTEKTFKIKDKNYTITVKKL